MQFARRHWPALIVAAFIPLLLASPIAARPAEASGCPSSTFCLWQNSNQGGAWRSIAANVTDFEFNGSFNNQASSLANGTATGMCAWTGAHRTGLRLFVGSGHHFRDLSQDIAPDGVSWNDRISSAGRC
jgi:hypothetical protein